jgi:hypothetical protein
VVVEGGIAVDVGRDEVRTDVAAIDEVPVGLDLELVDAVCRGVAAAPAESEGRVSPSARDKAAVNAR